MPQATRIDAFAAGDHQEDHGIFSGKEIENPRLNAEILIGHALALPRMQLYLRFEQFLAEADLEKIRPLVRRRGQREPLQYIIGETEFAGLRLKTDRRALIPRPETEYLIELAGTLLEKSPSRGLDLGTGAGALALALAKKFPDSRWVATDTSGDALALAGENLAALGMGDRVELLVSDWYQGLSSESKFDLIVANPPYLSLKEWEMTAEEVRGFEPKQALTPGDADGLSSLRNILAGSPRIYAARRDDRLRNGGRPGRGAAGNFVGGRASFRGGENRLDRKKPVLVRLALNLSRACVSEIRIHSARSWRAPARRASTQKYIVTRDQPGVSKKWIHGPRGRDSAFVERSRQGC